MRPALFALLGVLASARAAAATTPSTGQIVEDSTTIDIAQCLATPRTDVDLGDEAMDVGLTWNFALASGTTWAAGGTYQLYAANQTTAAGVSSGTSCTEPASTSTTFTVNTVGGETTIDTQSVTSAVGFSMLEIATAAGYGKCDADHAIYLCMQWSGPSGEVGWATATINLRVDLPAAPTSVTASPGDGRLHVGWSAGTGGAATSSTYKALATGADSVPHFSSQVSGSSAVISGLTNNQDYSVVVYAFSAANNPGAASAAITGTPQAVEDFWKHYKNAGGADSGGCATGVAGAFALLGSGALLALRRRRS